MENETNATLPVPVPESSPKSPASSSSTPSSAGRLPPLHPLTEQQAEQILTDGKLAAAMTNQPTAPMEFKMPPKPDRDDSAELARRRREDEKREREEAAKKLSDSRVPERYAQASLGVAESLPPEAADKWLAGASELQMLIESPGVALLLGQRGTGKTHMACALVRGCCLNNKSARYAKVLDYIGELKATFAKDSTKNERAVEREWLAPYLLVLDETQERHDSHFEQIQLTRLVDLRYDANKATVLITNQMLTEFQAANGTSIASRITDGGTIIHCDWESVRGRRNAKAGFDAH